MVHDDALEAALLEVLRPATWSERVRVRLNHGYTPVQVMDRLPEGLRNELCAGVTNPDVARRKVLDAVSAALRRMATRGLLLRRPADLKVDFRVKGARLIQVDVFRLP